MDFGSEPGPKMGLVVRGRAPGTSLSYHESGSHLFVSSEEDSVLRVVDCLGGTGGSSGSDGNGGGSGGGVASSPPPRPTMMIRLQREGIRTVRSTHHAHCVLFSPGGGGGSSPPSGIGGENGGVGGVPSSSSWGGGSSSGRRRNNDVHYHSIHDNRILRSFGGHTGTINGMSVSPVNDNFLSSSVDGTVRLWDIGTPGNSLAELRLPPDFVEGAPLAAFDSTGLVFGISAAMEGGEGYHVHLYDARNYTVGPFSEMKTTRQDIEAKIRVGGTTPERAYALSKAEWTSMEFNKSGKQILVCTMGGAALSLDGYEGSVLHAFQTEFGPATSTASTTTTKTSSSSSSPRSSSRPMAACFTPDDRSVICGNDDGSVGCYDAESGLLVRKIRGHPDRVGAVAANPRYSQFASACTNTAVWIL